MLSLCHLAAPSRGDRVVLVRFRVAWAAFSNLAKPNIFCFALQETLSLIEYCQEFRGSIIEESGQRIFIAIMNSLFGRELTIIIGGCLEIHLRGYLEM